MRRLEQGNKTWAHEMWCGVENRLYPQGASPGAAQQALMAVDAAARWCASERPASFSTALPIILQVAGDTDQPVVVRGAALAAAATVVDALGTSLLPLLPATAPAMLATATGLCLGGAEEEVDDEDTAGALEGRLLARTAALAGVQALVAHLGAFLTPYFTPLLKLLLHPALAADPAAAALRDTLTSTVPARLLLEPVRGAWASAASAGAGPATALLHLLNGVMLQLDRATAKAQHASLVQFLLGVLDRRGEAEANGENPAHVEAVEEAAVKAVVALTLKVSENTFRGMFLQTVQWGVAKGDADTPGGRARLHTLFKLARELAATLRVVMVPYFQHLLSPAVAALTAVEAEAAAVPTATTPDKKRRKGTAKGGRRDSGEAVRTVVDPAAAMWALRLEVVDALHKCFLYDTAVERFVDTERFEQVIQQPGKTAVYA